MLEALHGPWSQPAQKPGKDILAFMAMGLFFAGIAILTRSDFFSQMGIPVTRLQDLLPGGAWARMICFVVVFSLLTGVGMPRLWVSAVAGAAFGTLWGTLTALLATLAGAAMIYGIGRGFMSGTIQRRMGPRLSHWQARFNTNAFWWVLYMRLFPLSNATLAGLLCGAGRIPFRAYLAGSFIGFIPLTVVFSIFGKGGASGDFRAVALGAMLLAAAVGARKVLMKAPPGRKHLPV